METWPCSGPHPSCDDPGWEGSQILEFYEVRDCITIRHPDSEGQHWKYGPLPKCLVLTKGMNEENHRNVGNKDSTSKGLACKVIFSET